jgi:dipeptidyl aminopeptidase/acylaminoacyl peptidase
VTNEHLWVTNVANGESIDWMSTMDITVGDTTLVDVSGRGQTGPKWSRCGQKIRVVVSDKGVISRLTMTGPNTVLDTRPNVAAFDVAGPDHTFLEVGWDNAGVIRFPDGSVYDPNAELLAELALVEPVEIFSKTPSGHDAPAFVLRPAADGPAPTLVYIHGGPHTMYGAQNIFFEYQVLAAAGYCVIYPNPRGSKGYGEAWTSALKGDWGVPAMEDVMAGVDDAIARGWADADRLGVVVAMVVTSPAGSSGRRIASRRQFPSAVSMTLLAWQVQRTSHGAIPTTSRRIPVAIRLSTVSKARLRMRTVW